MSQRPVSLNPDLSRLRAEGLDILVGKSKHLFIRGVPYVNAAKEIKSGIIASVLDLAGETTIPPESHVVFFVGEPPCDEHGSALPGVSQNTNQALGEGLAPNHQISRKPTTGPNPGKYADYYEKIKTYIAIICGPAQAIDQNVTPYTHPVFVPDEEDDSVFNFLDTAATKAASSRPIASWRDRRLPSSALAEQAATCLTSLRRHTSQRFTFLTTMFS